MFVDLFYERASGHFNLLALLEVGICIYIQDILKINNFIGLYCSECFVSLALGDVFFNYYIFLFCNKQCIHIIQTSSYKKHLSSTQAFSPPVSQLQSQQMLVASWLFNSYSLDAHVIYISPFFYIYIYIYSVLQFAFNSNF